MSENIVPYGKQQNTTTAVQHNDLNKIQYASFDLVKEMVVKITIIAGLPARCIPENTEMFPHASYFFKTLREIFYDYTIDEILQAFRMAVRGDITADLKLYDSTLSAEYIGRVIKAYKAHKQNQPVTTNSPQQDAVIPEKTEQEKKKIILDGFLHAFSYYKQTGSVLNFGDSTYNFMARNRMFTFPESDKPMLNDKARQRREHLLNNDLSNARSSLERDRIRAAMKNIDTKSNDYERVLHEVAIAWQFEKWIENNVNPQNLIK